MNFIACLGLGVEFCIHLASSFASLSSSNADYHPHPFHHHAHAPLDQCAQVALSRIGPSVLRGITWTKCIGIGILFCAPSPLFQVYFARMYAIIVFLGALHALVLLPVLLARFGTADNRDSGQRMHLDTIRHKAETVLSPTQLAFMKGLLSTSSSEDDEPFLT